MKPTRLRRAATAVLGTVAGVFGASDPARADDAPSKETPSGTEGRAGTASAAPQVQPQAPAALAPAPPPAAESSPPPARPQTRPIPPQPARVRAVRAKRADERRQDK